MPARCRRRAVPPGRRSMLVSNCGSTSVAISVLCSFLSIECSIVDAILGSSPGVKLGCTGPILGEQGCLTSSSSLDRERLSFRSIGVSTGQRFSRERRGRGGQPSGDIHMADDLDAILTTVSPGFANSQFPYVRRQDRRDRAGTHRFDHRRR
jgi:hypothetical protein